MFIGTGMVDGGLRSPIAVVMLALADCRKNRLEEQVLGQAFGTAYDSYRGETWVLIPGIF